jgi:hypothetical protein
MPTGILINKRSGIETTSITSEVDNAAETATLTITVVISKATETDVEPTDPTKGILHYEDTGAGNIKLKPSSQDFVTLGSDGTGHIKFNLDIGVSGKIGGAGEERAKSGDSK